ncbi:MAG: hypothetical protein QOE11_1795 [Solirubrobacteraceae bacterium]|nr:hypothetical protein [Solirubrobacteraceae bacterium]
MAYRQRRSHSNGSGRTRVRRIAVLVVLALTAISGSALLAGAAVPTFPDNILIFPNRDFISVQGFMDHAGQTATIEITRAGKVVGSAQGVISGGDVAFEINHPGGVCWGNGTALQVTPDIVAGDTATIKFGGTASGDTTVQAAEATSVSYDGLNTVVVKGPATVGAGIDPTNIEQRTVNPDLVATIGKRDVRAVPGPPVTAPKSGPAGSYTSDLALNADGTFTATYVFDSQSVAATVANGGGERVLTWQQLDPAGNRQGVTIAEKGQLGGPGFGGCPTGPAQQIPPTPRSVSVVRPASDKTTMQVNWASVTAQPGADPVDGYSVELIAATSTAAGQQQRGIRTPVGVTKASFTGLDATETYAVEVRSTAGAHMSDPGVSSPPPDLGPPTKPVASPAGGANNTSAVAAPSGVTLTSNGQIYYTTDSSSPVNGDMPSDTAKLYADPIPVTGPTEIRAVALDQAGNISPEFQGFYKVPDAAAPPPAPSTAPDAPAKPTGTGGAHKATLQWTAGPASITDYRVFAYNAAGTRVSTTASKTSSATVIGLNAGDSYTFTVEASNDGATTWSAESLPSDPIRATDSVSITKVTWKVGDFRVTGAGSDATTPAGTVTLHNAATGAAIGPDTTVTAAAAPATGTTFDIRLKTGTGTTAATKPAKVYVTSSLGGRSPDVVVP